MPPWGSHYGAATAVIFDYLIFLVIILVCGKEQLF